MEWMGGGKGREWGEREGGERGGGIEGREGEGDEVREGGKEGREMANKKWK